MGTRGPSPPLTKRQKSRRGTNRAGFIKSTSFALCCIATLAKGSIYDEQKRLWLTYAWKDNEDKDIDFIVQELDKVGLEVKFDRRNLIPGQRLWEQIGGAIKDSAECDAWGIVLTGNSLASQACVEELSYALDRALSAKGEAFPVFALLHDITSDSLPPALKIRLCIPLGNNDWVAQTIAAVEGRPLGLPITGLDRWFIEERRDGAHRGLEIRPRFDSISPFVVAVDLHEKKSGNVRECLPGPANNFTRALCATGYFTGERKLGDGTKIWLWGANTEANSQWSYYLFYAKRPKRVWFGREKDLQVINFGLGGKLKAD